MADRPIFPNRLKAMLADANLSQADVVRHLGPETNKQTIHKLVACKTRFSDVWAKRLAPVFDMDWHDLLEQATSVGPTGQRPGPQGGQSAQDMDEAALLSFWRGLDEAKKKLLLRIATAVGGDHAA